MFKNAILPLVFGSAVLLAASAGANAQPSFGSIHQAIQTVTAQTNLIQVHHRKKKKFHAHARYYHMPYYCSWLKEKALHFGTRYWWDHYERCKYFNWYKY